MSVDVKLAQTNYQEKTEKNNNYINMNIYVFCVCKKNTEQSKMFSKYSMQYIHNAIIIYIPFKKI